MFPSVPTLDVPLPPSRLGEIIVGKHGGTVECLRLKILFPTESAGFGAIFYAATVDGKYRVR